MVTAKTPAELFFRARSKEERENIRRGLSFLTLQAYGAVDFDGTEDQRRRALEADIRLKLGGEKGAEKAKAVKEISRQAEEWHVLASCLAELANAYDAACFNVVMEGKD